MSFIAIFAANSAGRLTLKGGFIIYNESISPIYIKFKKITENIYLPNISLNITNNTDSIIKISDFKLYQNTTKDFILNNNIEYNYFKIFDTYIYDYNWYDNNNKL